MIITFLTITIASLVIAPKVIPSVKSLVRREEDKDEPNVKSEDDQVEKAKFLDTGDIFTEEELNQELALTTEPSSPKISTEAILKQASLVEFQWISSKDKKASSMRLDLAEKYRPTPSADSLFSDNAESAHVLESVNPDEAKRLIVPTMSGEPPKAARQLQEKTLVPPKKETQRTKQELPQSTQNVVNMQILPKSSQKNKSVIPIQMSTESIPQQQVFEVIKPDKVKKEKQFSLFEKPEVINVGERVWHSVQPLYIDFSPFFSLDSLIQLKDLPLSKNAIPQKTMTVKSANQRPFKLESDHQPVHLSHNDEGFHNPLIYSSSEIDEEESWDEENEIFKQDINKEMSDLDEMVPVWHSLLSLSNHFLYDIRVSNSKIMSRQDKTEESRFDEPRSQVSIDSKT